MAEIWHWLEAFNMKHSLQSNILDRQACYEAMRGKDPRFDGRFFVGVRTTGIFCRSVCSARLPLLENCTFFLSAAAAQAAGYRACLRCRPELAPSTGTVAPPLEGSSAAVVARALRMIERGALDEGSVRELAERLGVSDRTLRHQFAQHVGTSPTQVAKTRRLLFAKRLLDETSLPITEIAISAGFKSIRSFNSAFLNSYGRSPSAMRRSSQPAHNASDPITLKLPFSEPYSWQALMAFWQPRRISGIEVATAEEYCRSIVLNGKPGWVTVRPVAGESYLQVQIGFAQVSQLGTIMARLRQMFDVGVNIAAVEDCLMRSPLLKPLIAHQGLRVPGAWDAFELAVRAIVGQQVSVAAATTMFNRIVETYGEPLKVTGKPNVLTRVFPKASVLAQADLTALGLVQTRAKAISHLAQVLTENPSFFDEMTTLPRAIDALCALPGIGPWTAHYIAMRALNEPDAMPPGDVALLRAAKSLGTDVNIAQFTQLSENWRPWRAYAAMYLWQFDAQQQMRHPHKRAAANITTEKTITQKIVTNKVNREDVARETVGTQS